MIKLVQIALLLFLASTARAEPILQFSGSSASFEYVVQIDSEMRADQPPRRLRISCTRGCAARNLTENLSDAPIGVMQVRDDIPVILTTWIGATTYWVRGYALSDKGPSKVLEHATKAPPVVGADKQGRPMVTLLEPSFPADQPQGPLRTWIWNGQEFSERTARDVLEELARSPAR